MKLKTITTKLLELSSLPEAVQQEILPEFFSPGSLFWVKIPSTVKELKESPLWGNLCKEEDFKAGEYLLIESRAKKKNET